MWNQRDEGIESFHPALEKLARRGVSCFVANSAASGSYLARSLGVDPSLIRIVPNGVPERRPAMDADHWRMACTLERGATVCTMVANLSANKDHETLLAAWEIVVSLTSAEGLRPVLLLAGRMDNTGSRIQALAKRGGLKGTVRLLGPVDDVTGLLGITDVFVMSSRSEGLSNAVVEAALAGLPVAGTAIPGIANGVSRENRDFLTPAGDAQALANAILKMIREPGTRLRLGSANRSHALREFSVEQMCARMEGIIVQGLAGIGA
jgi:glycosyltransferase involved in cell wall biosynthesis